MATVILGCNLKYLLYYHGRLLVPPWRAPTLRYCHPTICSPCKHGADITPRPLSDAWPGGPSLSVPSNEAFLFCHFYTRLHVYPVILISSANKILIAYDSSHICRDSYLVHCIVYDQHRPHAFFGYVSTYPYLPLG
jgi:hypothetical protein